ncbi:MAG: MerR family transcriptional regulator [Clostridia bacterium]|nr:MerR family transcriptional regulator [Clostridia bacterium]
MLTVQKVARLAGVSVRTLHHYDALGLLVPTAVTDAGYRLYDDAALERLQSILLFRELRFPLKDIKAIIDSPGFDRQKALRQQIELLELQRSRLNELIDLARGIIETGVNSMDFSAFDRSELDRFSEEAKAAWSNTAAYREYSARATVRGGEEEADLTSRFMAMFARIGELRGEDPADVRVQERIGELQRFITEHYYTCTDEILSALGAMYTDDERMKCNIDRAGGEGTAAFTREAIDVFCAK